MAKDEFTRLVDNLVSGELGLTHVQIAVKTSVRRSKVVPDNIKDLLCGKSDIESGLIFKFFQLMSEVMGNVELAYRRGNQGGNSENMKYSKHKGKKKKG